MHCVKFSRKVCANETQNISAPVIGKGTTVSYERAHGLFGHTGKDMSMQIANHLEIKIDKKKKILVKTVLLAKQDKIACQKRVNM